jgi:hypothetical protein
LQLLKVYNSPSKTSFHGYISITDNGLAFDDNFYFSISKIKKINVPAIGEGTQQL